MNLAKYILFVAAVVGLIVAIEKFTGAPLLDDADARTVPFHHIP